MTAEQRKLLEELQEKSGGKSKGSKKSGKSKGNKVGSDACRVVLPRELFNPVLSTRGSFSHERRWGNLRQHFLARAPAVRPCRRRSSVLLFMMPGTLCQPPPSCQCLVTCRRFVSCRISARGSCACWLFQHSRGSISYCLVSCGAHPPLGCICSVAGIRRNLQLKLLSSRDCHVPAGRLCCLAAHAPIHTGCGRLASSDTRPLDECMVGRRRSRRKLGGLCWMQNRTPEFSLLKLIWDDDRVLYQWTF